MYCILTHKQQETHACVFSTVATDALVLKHYWQAISIHGVEKNIHCIGLVSNGNITFIVNNNRKEKDILQTIVEPIVEGLTE